MRRYLEHLEFEPNSVCVLSFGRVSAKAFCRGLSASKSLHASKEEDGLEFHSALGQSLRDSRLGDVGHCAFDSASPLVALSC